MPTKIILKETGKILDTSPDMNIEFKINSPIYEREAGSQTISDVLPNSVENKKSIGFVGRTDRIDKPKDLLPVIIEDGIYIRNGEMHISGATEQGIQFSIGMDESLLYANIKNKRIKDLENFPAYIPWDGYSERQKIENCISHLNNQRLDVNAPLTYFSVLLEDEMIQTGEGEEVIENRVPFVVNPTRIVDATTEFTDYLVWESRNLPIAIDGEVFHIQTIDGYGIAPFCKIWKIIEIIFENLGYHVAENVFFSHEQLRTLTSLHNVVDAICRGQINFRDLMPDMTIQKFLDALYYKFGALFLINSNDRTVRVRLLKDILANMSHKDVTALKSSPLAWVNVPSKQVSLKMNTSLKYAAPPSERIEDFINKYGNTIARTSFITTGSLTPNPNLEGIFSIVQDVETGLYYKQFGALQERGFQLLGSDFFNWDKLTANTEYETLDSTDESVPNIIIPNYGAFNINYDYSVPAYLKGRRHIYSQTEFDDTDKKSESNEKEPENLAFVFYYGRINSVSLNVRDGDQSEVVRESYFFASSLLPTRLTPTEKDKFPFSLTSRSLYDYFWRDWDICLRYSNQEYTGTFAMSKLDCLTFDMSQKLLRA